MVVLNIALYQPKDHYSNTIFLFLTFFSHEMYYSVNLSGELHEMAELK